MYHSKSKGQINVVVMDMMMPTMDGSAAVRALRIIDPLVKIIGTSGLLENHKFLKGSTGIQAFLSKPALQNNY